MKIVFTPDWFINNDVLINVFSFLVLFVFFLFATKSYQLSKKKSVLYLGIGFLIIALGELSTVLTKFVLYYDTEMVRQVGQTITVTYEVVKSVDIFYYTGFFFNKFLTLVGLYVIYKLPMSSRPGIDFLFNIYLLFVVAWLSHTIFYLYHLTALIILILIIIDYCGVYARERRINTKIFIIAFTLLALSQTFFMLSQVNYVYVAAQSIQLVSYITLLLLVVKILKNGKEEKQSRHRTRHA